MKLIHQESQENEENEPQLNQQNEDSAATSITHKLGMKDPLADFHKLEVMMINRNEFENWE